MEQEFKPENWRTPWNKGKLIGQKLPLKLKEIWAIRIRLQLAKRARELALFNLAIDSKLRACDLIRLRVSDVAQGNQIASRAIVMQRKTQRPVQFEITEQTREPVAAWIASAQLKYDQYLFPSRISESPHISTRQYARVLDSWVRSIGLVPAVQYPLDASDQSDANLPPNEEPSCGSTSPWTYEARKYCAVSWNRGRRCVGDIRTDGGVGVGPR